MIPYPDIIQNSEEWEALRRVRPTASNASKIITAVKGDLSKSARDYAVKLATQSLFDSDPDPVKWTGNANTDNGNEREQAAREAYTALTGFSVDPLGFATTLDSFVGCSPDGMVRGPDGAYLHGLEIKCPTSAVHVDYLLGGTLPDEYKQQVHTSLYVTGLQRWDFFSYFPTLAPFHLTIYRDAYTDKLAAAMDEFRILYVKIKAEVLAAAKQPLSPHAD
jgi:hypothetical protein